MIILTGAAGFIGSALVAHLNELGHTDLWLVDDFERYPAKAPNLKGKAFLGKSERDEFLNWMNSPDLRKSNPQLTASREMLRENPTLFIHLGARTDTAEKDPDIFHRLNLAYSQAVWHFCQANNVPLIYASSAATYGGGEHGYDDAHELTDRLQPLNPYGQSKQDFDRWALAQRDSPPRWYGLKFFNVYGPNEYHKGRMASVVWHAFRQIKQTGAMKLFRSHRADVADGQQSRDFIYVKDLCRVISWLAFTGESAPDGLYNLGTGQARPFIDLVNAVFSALEQSPEIGFIDTPVDIRDTYQYFTEANMRKLRAAGYPHPFNSLEAGIEDYVTNYLQPDRYW